ncbi:uncharacterized protein Z520_02901 [Fonsecaea multimorphosa CBS 102226]|uniref:Transcription factor domain-containing protein n=1 Tax=Fonsecaea multimorphosa CBS 102226 TaxID=1442371 RepID=A0A0D2KX03_9EURO|nr:uncharacterized protein Z520_02901 [Fonsecaea multimorphosa CBS 102226]KIY01349.1 hypothetical protein Z520_02901 [Fonsecaea multimorphosa CBS 102226]OAL28625.1 hypothetical protein AYO22_02819 [Fonsecaea multimorphosa]
MGESRYLFVVKDPKSLSFSRSDDHERRLIHRHAQIDSMHRRRASPNHKIYTDGQLPFIQVNPGIKAGTSNRPVVHDIPRVPADEMRIIDPFASTVVNVDRKAHGLLQYFIHVSHPRTWYSEVQNDRTYTFQKDVLALVKGCLENEVHFYTLLASMASQMEYFDLINRDDETTSQIATKAIGAVRQHLRSSPLIDQRLIFDIHQLAVTDFYRYELKSALIHLTAAKSLLSHIGGIDRIDPSLREWIVIGDGYLAAELLQKPLFPASCFDPGDLEPEHANDTGDHPDITAQWFQEPKYVKILPNPMHQVLLDLAATVDAMRRQSESEATDGNAPAGSKASLHWLLLRTSALRHRLLELDIDDGKVDAIRIVLIIWLFMVMTVTGRRRTCKVLASKLRRRLEGIGREDWNGYGDVHLWVLLVGAMSCETKDRGWFLQAILETESPGSWDTHKSFSEDELAKLFSRFSYLDLYQRGLLQAVSCDLNVLAPHTAGDCDDASPTSRHC